MADEKKLQIAVPELPNTVAGDGRHVMSLLRKYLKEMAVQINLANGFEGVPETSSGYAAPSGFVLKFSVDGGTLSWNDVSYYDQLAYYELRTDRNVGESRGLLERTTENTSMVLPDAAASTVYLYAVLRDKTYSNPSVLTYSKKRPDAPQKINLTKNEQGVLVQFTEIPLDCIGAHIYIGGTMLTSGDNIFLYKLSENENIDTVGVAYYDQFGDGERAVIYNNVPDVTGFLVERNGAVLDFYWDPIELHGVSYAVQVSETGVWGTGLELFTTELNKKKLEYPNAGGKYFLIKAADEHGNWSENAAMYHLVTADDPSKNVIVEFDEGSLGYPGNKYGMYYDPTIGGLKIADEMMRGEYIFSGELDQTYRARNWADYKTNLLRTSNLRISDLTDTIDSTKLYSMTLGGGELVGGDIPEVRSYLAEYIGMGTRDLLLASLESTTDDDSGNAAAEAVHADTFTYGRWNTGLSVEQLTKLSYDYEGTETFHAQFVIRLSETPTWCTIAVFSNGTDWLELGYDGGFYLKGSDGKENRVTPSVSSSDCITFSISQGAEIRALRLCITSLSNGRDTLYESTINAAPIGAFTNVRFYRGELT